MSEARLRRPTPARGRSQSSSSRRARGLDETITPGPLIAVVTLASAFLVASQPWAAASFSLRLSVLGPTGASAFPAGSDLTLGVAWGIQGLTGVPRATALFAASAAGWIAFALLHRTARSDDRSLIDDICLLGNPLALSLVLTGRGWALPALYVLFVALMRLRTMPAFRSVPIVGLGLGAATLGVPGHVGMLMPLFAALPFIMPPEARRMDRLIGSGLVALAPVAMIILSSLYVAVLLGHDPEGGLRTMLATAVADTDYALPVGLLLLGVAATPLIVSVIRGDTRAAFGMVLVAVLTIAVAFRVPLPVVLAAAALGAVMTAPTREGPLLPLIGFAAAVLCVIAPSYMGGL